jgi:hypothetical protein
VAFGDVGANSFEFYEGIRIVIPGALLVALIEALRWTLDVHHKFEVDFATALVGAVALGLVCLYVDFPRLAAVYNRDLPSDVFADTYAEQLNRMEAYEDRNAFFVVQDAAVPSVIRARSLYSGSMFRIGFEAIVFIGSFQAVPWLVAIHANGTTPSSDTHTSWWLLAVAALPLLGPVWIETTRKYREIAPKTPHRMRDALLAAPRIVLADLSTLDAVVVVVAALSLGFGLATRHGGTQARSLLTVAVTLVTLLWLARFVFGKRGAESIGVKGREAFNRVTLLLLFIAATYVGAVAGLYRGHSAFISDQTRVNGWIIAAALTSLLIASRGIEKRLRGGYSTLTVWLKLNPERVGEALGWNKPSS